MTLCLPESSWVWADDTVMPLPTAAWHEWFTGEPDNAASSEHCSVMTNYRFWELHKVILDAYFWRDYSCDFNPANEIQGYICERTYTVHVLVYKQVLTCWYRTPPPCNLMRHEKWSS